MTKKCSVCGRTMSGEECGDERVCDECAGYCDMSDTSCEMCEVVDCHRALGLATLADVAYGTQREWSEEA